MRSYEALSKYAECEDAKCAQYEKYAEYVKNCKICRICRICRIWIEKTSVQNQVPGLASSLPGKYGQHYCHILILRFQHCPLPLASICFGAALLKTVLHWQLTHSVEGNSSLHFNLSHSTPTRISDRRQSDASRTGARRSRLPDIHIWVQSLTRLTA